MTGRGILQGRTRFEGSDHSRDTGAVAVVVALAVSSVLLVTAAFAVDFGNAFAQRTDLQGIADDAARAGAAQLPDQAAATAAAIANLCAQPADRTGWNYSGCSGSPASAPSLAGSPAADITFTTQDGVATGITVVPAPIRVPFSFGQAVGTDSIRVSAGSSARIATALGVGVLPFALYQDQLASTPTGTNGQFCIGPADPDDLPTDPPPPAMGTVAGGPFSVSFRLPTSGSSTSLVWNSGALVQVRSDNSGPYRSFNLSNVQIFLGGAPIQGVVLAPGSTRRYQAAAPVYKPGTTKVWMEADYAGQHMVSNALTITYTGTVTNLCGSVAPTTGYLDVARDPDAGAGPRLRDNVAAGLDTTLHPWPNWPNPPQNGATLPAPHAECGALDPAGVRRTTVGTPVQDINCVTVTFSGLPSAAAEGFFGPGGRMFRRCGGGTRPAPSPFSGAIDDTRLFATGSPLLVSGVDPTQLKSDLQAGALPATGSGAGWISSKIFDCPRFGIVPVLDRDPTVDSGTHEYPVLGYRYVWIDDDTANRGFLWSGTTLVGIRGYIIDPDVINPQTESPLVGHTSRIGRYQDELWDASQGTPASRRLPRVVVLGPP